MIARDVEITDLRPDAWKNLMSLVEISRIADVRPASPNLLSVLHHGGKVLRVYAPAGFRVPAIEQVGDPQELAKKLYYQLPGLDGVQILEKDSLILFSDHVQRSDWISNDLEDFMFRAYALAEQDPAGLAFYPQFNWKWNGLPLESIRAWFASGPDPCAYFLGITRDSAPWLTLILRVMEKKIRLITTIDFLARFNIPVAGMPSSPKDLATVCEAIHTHVAPIRSALICDYMTFARLLSSEDKRRDLTLAMADGSASSFGIIE
ncbi:MAG: hypothetical protein JW748_03705 [Anaerolineales bacterium]|nr:hypothetical protein [Anaerolineales bacterium]